MQEKITTIRDVFPQKTVAIIGDLVADQFLNGTISRVSREAPVFILKHDGTSTVPGAAANAAVNVASLGGNASLIGIVGDDPNGKQLVASLRAKGVDTNGVIAAPDFSTTTKVRVLAGQHYAPKQQVIRIDYEDNSAISDETKRSMREAFSNIAAEADSIIISDYGYGAVFEEIVDDARRVSTERGIPLIVDSRYGLEQLGNATTATPNREEVENILGKDPTAEDCAKLRERLGLDSLLVTNGNEGMLLVERDREPIKIEVVGSTEPVDVTGAGDTVIAAYSLALASGSSFYEAANVANHAGGLVVMKRGTASINASELIESLRSDADELSSPKSA